MNKIKELCVKYRELIVYVIVGFLTTIFCWVVAWIMEHFIFDSTVAIENFLINTICWVAGVLFAYPLNRKWVFKSTNPHIIKEFFGFSGSRLSTYFLDIFIMWLFVNVFPFTGLIKKITDGMGKNLEQSQLDSLNFWVAKIFISSVLVMIANYVFSKLLIFKKDKTKENSAESAE